MIYPPLLKHGDQIRIVAPAGKLNANALENVTRTMNQWGLEVQLGDNVYGDNGYFSGTDEERLADLQAAIDDKSIAAIIAARGGYGMTRILEKINYSSLRDNPKWVIGFSDLTAIQLKLLSLNMASIHGPMGTSFNMPGGEDSFDALKSLLFTGESSLISTKPEGRKGTTRGILTGGNLALLTDSLGTNSEVKTDNRILVLEEIGEKTYRVDRMLNQLKRAGKLDKLAGLVIGDFSDIDDGDTPFGSTWKQALDSIIKDYKFPVAYGFKVGHEALNYPVVMGTEYELDVKPDSATLSIKSELA
jgi:muramoyltetrapeptide carboxypeptidase